MSVNHYENFPVASILLPSRLRPAVKIIYRFARTADDIADEGDATAAQRLALLEQYEIGIHHIAQGAPTDHPLFRELGKVIRQHNLPIQPFRDLLSAFKQDVTTQRYPDFAGVLDYCARSANPVGAIMLHLYQAATAENLRLSDSICSALQLINFWQDVALDWDKRRIYLPLQDLASFGISEQQLADGQADCAWQTMMRFQVQRARDLLLQGSPLAKRLPGRMGWELRLVVQGGLRILELLDEVDGDVFSRRPKLGKSDWLLLTWRALRM